ncbi:MAG TPA: hypothetical protein VGD50_03275, partial [Candidatus Baltobacteraceae bacterium]
MFRMPANSRRLFRAASALFACTYALGIAAPAAASSRALETFSLPDQRVVNVFPGGLVEVQDAKKHTVKRVAYPAPYSGIGGTGLPDKAQLVRRLLKTGAETGYVPGSVIVVYRDGIGPSTDTFTLLAPELAQIRTSTASVASAPISDPRYTNDSATNHVLRTLAVASEARLFTHANRTLLSAAYARHITSVGAAAVNPASAFRLRVAGASVHDAVLALLKLPSVAYASPEWYVQTMRAPSAYTFSSAQQQNAIQMSRHVPASFGRSTRAAAVALGGATLPTNFALTTSQQSLLNA